MRLGTFLLLAVGFGLPRTSAAQTVALLDTALLGASRLREASGVTTSARPGVYWAHNDSGDDPFLYATDSLGRDLGRLRVIGAGAVDWEDIEAGPCVTAPGRCLYIADMGDNRAQRRSIVIYRVREPEPPTAPADTLRTVRVLDSLVFAYPDGPRDAESLMLTSGGRLFVVSKPRAGWPHLYGVDLRAPAARVLADLGPLPVAVSLPRGRLITGGAISPDDRWVVLRTYVSLHFFTLDGGARFRPVTDPDGIPIPVVEAQGEGIAFDGPARLVLISEQGQGGHSMLSRLRVALPAP